MERDLVACEQGVADACSDISAGRLRWFSGAPSEAAWGKYLAVTLKIRFGIDVTFVGCLTWTAKYSHEEGYNSTMAAHVDSVWGDGAFATALAEGKRHREELYDAWHAARAAELNQATSDNDADS